jgi:hypothetical protein
VYRFKHYRRDSFPNKPDTLVQEYWFQFEDVDEAKRAMQPFLETFNLETDYATLADQTGGEIWRKP